MLNADAGTLLGAPASSVGARVAVAFAAAGLAATSVSLVPANGIGTAVREALGRGVDAVAVGGGDGTLAAAAAVLVDAATPLGVLPLGTLNHFARDLAIPPELSAAAAVIAGGCVLEADVGEVNGRVFLNNSSIGLYAEAVEGREALRRRVGLRKWLAMAAAALAALRRLPLSSLEVAVDGERHGVHTPFVFVGNNVYELRLPELGRRAALDRGVLCLYVARHETRPALLRLALRALWGRLDQDRDFRSFVASRIEIDSRRDQIRVALDGELLDLAPPVVYSLRRRALRVLVPPC